MHRLTILISLLTIFLFHSFANNQFVGDGKTLNTQALQQAIDEISNNGGGCLTLTPGTYLTGMLIMKSNVELHLEAGATLLGSTNPYDYDAPKGIGKRGDLSLIHI